MSFSQTIINWYLKHKRDLPWRNTQDPYVIWLSEIILQQTRVEQGMPYFERFLNQYPDVASFANASEDDILRLWQGLGYYSRARNMHRAAKQVINDMDSIFPTSYSTLLTLPGVGEYTAAAISSFSANEPQAVVDGNVYRVLARYFGIDTPINSTQGKAMFRQIAQDLLDDNNPGIYNQAIMEFGAIQCRPKAPLCADCVISQDCIALKSGKVPLLPMKNKAKASRDRFFNYFIIQNDEEPGLYMHKRSSGDIWQNLYEFPLLETQEAYAPEALSKEPLLQTWFGKEAIFTPMSNTIKHVLSHQNIYAQFFKVEQYDPHFKEKKQWDYVLLKDLDKLAKPKLIYAFLNTIITEL